MKTISALWSISLAVDCPKCDHFFDLIDSDSFKQSGIKPLAVDCTYETSCPECGHEFTVELEY